MQYVSKLWLNKSKQRFAYVYWPYNPKAERKNLYSVPRVCSQRTRTLKPSAVFKRDDKSADKGRKKYSVCRASERNHQFQPNSATINKAGDLDCNK